MKKSVLTVALIIGAATTTMAQDKQYTPEADDWAIGIDATPFLSYFGNFIGGNDGNTAPSWNFLTNNQTITGKYFTASDMAYRGALRIGFGSESGSLMVANRLSTVAPEYPAVLPEMVENSWSYGSMNIGLAGGLEWRKGSGRLQGYYGGELGISLSSSSATYTYGNDLTQSSSASANNVDVSNADDLDGNNLVSDPFGNSARMLSSKSGTAFGVGLRGFIGAEYFVLPKLSIGGEFGWGLMFMANGTASVNVESEGLNSGGTEVSETFTTETKNGSTFGIDTDAMNTVFGNAGTIRMTFHF